MIAYILHRPNGDGTYTATSGFTTGDASVTIDGMSCLPGRLSDVGTFSHRADISRATGCLPEAVGHDFSIIDWDGLTRNSVGILDGSAQLVGWLVSAYVSRDGVSWSSPILGAMSLEIVGAPASDGLIHISCRERWIGNRKTVGFGTGSDVVGLVAGGAQVSVKIPEISDISPITRNGSSGWSCGNGLDDYSVAPISTEFSTGVVDMMFAFKCANVSDAIAFNDSIISAIGASGAAIAGELCVESISGTMRSGDTVYISVSQEMIETEKPEKVSIYALDSSSVTIIGGSTELVGFVGDDGRTAMPVGEKKITGNVLSFSPSLRTPNGFRAYSLLPIDIAWSSLSPGLDLATEAYYGNTQAIITDGSAPPEYSAFDADLKPSASSTWTMWCRVSDADALTAGLRIIRKTSGSFSRYAVDISDRIVVNQAFSMSGYVSTRAVARWPYHKGNASDFTSAPLYNSSDPALRNNFSIERNILGPGIYVSRRSYDDFDSINSTPGLNVKSIDDKIIYCNYQIRAVSLYGISELSFGSSYAVVQPGASPWWSSPRTPSQAARDLLDAIGGSFASSAPSLAVSASSWGRYFDPSTALFDAAKEIANELWLFLGRGINGATAGAEGEILSQPSFTLGDRSDIVTEIVIEYDEWAGTYRRKAYIAHVDGSYDPENPSRYFGGWDDDGAETGYGLAIWNACRKAWQIHGIQARETFQAPSIHSPGAIGRLWTSSYNGKTRAQWLALQSRYLTLQISETAPEWWAGNSVRIPTTVADWSGYDLADVASQYLICTEKTWDPMTLTTTFEVALPPVTSIGTQRRIMQTLDASNRITQRLDATERIIQVQE